MSSSWHLSFHNESAKGLSLLLLALGVQALKITDVQIGKVINAERDVQPSGKRSTASHFHLWRMKKCQGNLTKSKFRK
jgi:hypothetical protein